MDRQMLVAAREAAWAAQSAAEAAWWALIPNAIAAVGTVGALIFAVVAANASARAQQQRQAATLIGLSHAFGTASQLLATGLELSKSAVPLKVAVESMLATGGFQTQLEIVRSVRLTEFPSVRVLAQFNAGHAALATLLDDMRLSVAEGGIRLTTLPHVLADGATKLATTADALDSEARRLVWPWPIS